MKKYQAIRILIKLANGDNSLINDPALAIKTARALSMCEQLIKELLDRVKLTEEEKKVHNLLQGHPINRGVKWTEARQNKLTALHEDGVRIEKIAKKMGRSTVSIECQLKNQGLLID